MSKLQDFNIDGIDGGENPLQGLDGQVVLLVNVASQCGLTPQYSGLQQLYTDLKDEGFAVVGLPCNQFGAQEPGSEDEIVQFCETKFGVGFPLTEKIEVNGRRPASAIRLAHDGLSGRHRVELREVSR